MSVICSHIGSRAQILSAFCYAGSSVCILIFNKIVLSTYRFNFPVLMTLFHMCVCIFVLSAMRKGNLLSYAAFDWSLARRAIPLSLCFVANIVMGMVALRATDIPMFATLRRLTVMFVIVNEYCLLAKKPTVLIVLSVQVMIIGSLIGGWGDLHFDPLGYLFVILNNAITALYLVWMKRTFNETKLQHDQFGVMYYNSLLAIPALLIISLLNGEAASILSFPFLWQPGFQLAFAISALMSFLMNYSIFWCTQANSALTTSVTGQVKNVLSSFVSVFAFGVSATPALIVGLSVGLSGSFLYAFAIYEIERKSKREKSLKERQDGLTDLATIEGEDNSRGLIKENGTALLANGMGGGATAGGSIDSSDLLSPTSQSALASVGGATAGPPPVHPSSSYSNGSVHQHQPQFPHSHQHQHHPGLLNLPHHILQQTIISGNGNGSPAYTRHNAEEPY